MLNLPITLETIDACPTMELTARNKRNSLIKDAADVYPVCNDDFDNNPYLFN